MPTTTTTAKATTNGVENGGAAAGGTGIVRRPLTNYFEVETADNHHDNDNEEYFDDDNDDDDDDAEEYGESSGVVGTSVAVSSSLSQRVRSAGKEEVSLIQSTLSGGDDSVGGGSLDQFDDDYDDDAGLPGTNRTVLFGGIVSNNPHGAYASLKNSGTTTTGNPYLPFYAGAGVVVVILLGFAILVPTSKKVEYHRHCQQDFTASYKPYSSSASSFETTWNDLLQYYRDEKDLTPVVETIPAGDTTKGSSPKSKASMEDRPPPSRCHSGIPSGETCTCKNEAVGAVPSGYTEVWQKAYDANLQILATENRSLESLDVVLLGDSITEHWQGMAMGNLSPKWQPNLEVYQDLFVHTSSDSEDSATASLPIQGLALGISGDRTPQVLYRLENGFLKSKDDNIDPFVLNPKVWWLLIGTNDMAYADWCSVDAVVSGIIQITQTILQARPYSTVVINSILPLGDAQGLRFWDGYYSVANEMLECFAATSEMADRIEFFNATSLFLNSYTSNNDADAAAADSEQRLRPSVNESLLPDGCHPNAIGSLIWGEAIIEKVKQVTGRAVYQKPSGVDAAENGDSSLGGA